MAKTKEKRFKIDDEVQHLLKEMETTPTDSEEYKQMAASLKTLCEARAYKGKNDIGLETLLGSMFVVLEVGMVLYHEQLNVVSSAVWNRIPRIGK